MTNTQRETLQRISGMLFCLSFNSDVGEQAENAMEMLNDLLQDDALAIAIPKDTLIMVPDSRMDPRLKEEGYYEGL